jgi:hypothetical protein
MFNKRLNKIQLDSRKASNVFLDFGKKEKDGRTSVGELLKDFHENGLLLMILFFALPVVIPLPYPPGFTTIIGIPLILLSIQMLLGFRHVFLPKAISKYEISNNVLITISNKVVPILRWIELYIKPRYSFAQFIYCEQIIGFMSLICAISVAIPLPLTNSIPALGIALMVLGLLNRDGIVILCGLVISIIGLFIAAVAVFASLVSIKYLFNLFF